VRFFAVNTWISFVSLHLRFQGTAWTIMARAVFCLHHADNPAHSIGYGGNDDDGDNEKFHEPTINICLRVHIFI